MGVHMWSLSVVVVSMLFSVAHGCESSCQSTYPLHTSYDKVNAYTVVFLRPTRYTLLNHGLLYLCK